MNNLKFYRIIVINKIAYETGKKETGSYGKGSSDYAYALGERGHVCEGDGGTLS